MSKKTGTNQNCEVCGTIFYVPGWRATQAKYCSQACAGVGRPKRKSHAVDIVCTVCSTVFKVNPGRVKTAKYCSHRCHAIASLPAHSESRKEAAAKANSARRQFTDEEREVRKKAVLARWYSNNLDKVKVYGAKRYVEKRDSIKAVNKSWYEANAQSVSEKTKIKMLDETFAEARRANRRRHYRENKPSYVANARKREERISRATPLWADFDKILEFYKLADRMTTETGITHHVDHVIPLCGKHVCGLHVENNLQVITREDNLKKGNKFNQEAEILCLEP